MVDVISTFAVISGIVFLGFFAEIIFKKTNIPDVLILIIVGICIGTFLEWTDAQSLGESVALFTSFALIFILFQGALSIDFKSLMKSLGPALSLTVLNFVFTVIAVTLVANFLLEYNFMLSLLVGMILAGTSSAVVIPLVSSIENVKEKYKLALTLESALSDVLCIIGTLTILEIMKTGELVASSVFNNILTSFSLALVVGIIWGIVWVFLLNRFQNLTSSYMLTIASVVGLYAFVESSFVSASGAIAALSFGLILGNAKILLQSAMKEDKENDKEIKVKKSIHKTKDLKKEDSTERKRINTILTPSAKNFYSEISFFVKTFFFVYLGILIDFTNLDIFWYGALITAAIFIVRPFSVKIIFGKEKPQPLDRTLLEILIPKGLAAAVLAGVAVQSGVLGDLASSFTTMILSVVLISIVVTSILMLLAQNNMFKGFFPSLGVIEKEDK